MSERRFVPGDRVRATDEMDDSDVPSGTEGTVMLDDRSVLPYSVDFDNNVHGWWCYPQQIELVAPEPRVWVMEVPDLPADVQQVAPLDAPGRVFTRSIGLPAVWWDNFGTTVSWSDLMRDWIRGVREVVPDPYAEAVKWFRDNPGEMVVTRGSALKWERIVTILEKVVDES